MNIDLTIKGRIHSLFTGGMVDGPGIRSVVFLSGCDLRCKYCHNPDTWQYERGDEVTVQEIYDEVIRYKNYYKHGRGGVTVSGGEPMFQPLFLATLLEALKVQDIHTAIDTSGSCSPEHAKRILQSTDLLIYDMKTINPDIYFDVTGIPINRSLNVLNLASEMNIDTWVRFVLVPGLTDNMDDIHEMARYLKEFINITKIEVLPFHKKGEYKWADLKIPYELRDTEPPSNELVREVEKILC